MAIGSLAGITEAFKKLAAGGVQIRGIADISCTDISYVGPDWTRTLGRRCRYPLFESAPRDICLEPDRKSFSFVSGEPRRFSLSEPTTVLWIAD
jgi:hypothetical protein